MKIVDADQWFDTDSRQLSMLAVMLYEIGLAISLFSISHSLIGLSGDHDPV